VKEIRRARPQTLKWKKKFRDGVFARDGRICRMEIWVGGEWREHGVRPTATTPVDPSHIYGSDQCGPVKGEPIVGIASCRKCHQRYEGSLHDGIVVRVPPDREAVAYRLISLAVTKWHVARRLPPESPAVAA
jgi:hypothetical protein